MSDRHAKAFEGSAAEVYNRGRAPYPPVLVEALGLPPGSRVLDLAAGTGLLSEALTRSGFDVVSVEPSAAMRRQLPAALDGRAEAIPLDDGAVDAVVVGDAWHWFDAERAAAEVYRVLRPGGSLVLVWRRAKRHVFEGELAERLRGLRDDHPAFVGDQGRHGVDGHGGFSDWAHRTVEFTHDTDRDGELAMLASASYVAVLPEDQREELLAQAAEQIPGGSFGVVYRAEIWSVSRTG